MSCMWDHKCGTSEFISQSFEALKCLGELRNRNLRAHEFNLWVRPRSDAVSLSLL